MTFPACEECRRHPEVARHIGGNVTVYHRCCDHSIQYRHDNEERAVAWWRAVYAEEEASC